MQSLWRATCPIEKREPLAQNRTADAVVIGAGITGILTAFLLQKTGKEVVVLERGRIAGGQTEGTTAKITAQHGLIYRRLMDRLGEGPARQYAQANQEAVAAYLRLIREEAIDCDLQRTCAYVYSQDLRLLAREAAAAKQLGLSASLVERPPLPFPAAGAVRFRDQAQFHPLKFIRALAQKLTIYENTPVQWADDQRVQTPGGTVRAKKILFTCHDPFVNFPGLYFARMHQERSYVLALENAPFPAGMWIGADRPAYSFRRYGDLLLFGGQGHRTGKNPGGGQYAALRRAARTLFPQSREVYAWSAQDGMPAGGIPYIGPYSPSRSHWYVAAGFQKWGMSTAMAAAILLSGALCSKEPAWAPVFRPGYLRPGELAAIGRDGKESAAGLARRFFAVPPASAGELAARRGGVVLWNGKKAGVYKESAAAETVVSPRCPHLGCQLAWNPEEKSWDCPCHGSRFDRQGKLLNGPAQTGLPARTRRAGPVQ